MSNILVGFDFSAGSAYAVDLAINIANRIGLDLRLVFVKEKDQDEEEQERNRVNDRITDSYTASNNKGNYSCASTTNDSSRNGSS